MDLYTHPGKMGDLLWALPTAKAAARSQFDLAVSSYCQPIIPLLQQQPYISHAYVLDNWHIQFDAPITPAVPPWHAAIYDRVYHLGMREWPTPTLVEYYPKLMLEQYGQTVEFDLNEPWLDLTSVDHHHLREITLVFTDEWAELKYGWISALIKALPSEQFRLCLPLRSRLAEQFMRLPLLNYTLGSVVGLTTELIRSKLVITDNSLGHPLSTALGKRTIIAECSPPRQQPVFKAPAHRNTYFDGINSFELVDVVVKALSS